MTIEIGWWLVPAFITLAGFITANKMTQDHSSGGFMDLSAFFNFVTYVLFFIVPSLVAWLIWSLLK